MLPATVTCGQPCCCCQTRYGTASSDRDDHARRPSTSSETATAARPRQRHRGDDRDDPDLRLGLETDPDHHARGQQQPPFVTGERTDDEPEEHRRAEEVERRRGDEVPNREREPGHRGASRRDQLRTPSAADLARDERREHRRRGRRERRRQPQQKSDPEPSEYIAWPSSGTSGG